MTFRQILSVTFVSTVMLCACTNETEESSAGNDQSYLDFNRYGCTMGRR